MTLESLAFLALASLLVILNGLDWHSTERVRRQNAHNGGWDAARVSGSWWWPLLPGWWQTAMVRADVELNPLLALAIAYLGRHWWLAKVPLVAVMVGGAWAAPRPWGHGLLVVACVIYGRVVFRNYRLDRSA